MDGPRPVKPDEFESLAALLNNVFSSHGGHLCDSLPLLFDCRNRNNLFVFADNGRVVSHAGLILDEIIISGCRLVAASIGCVATYEEYRGKGLAMQCLLAAEEKAIQAGASVTYISGSRGLYTRFGAVKVGRSFGYKFPAMEVGRGVSLQEATLDDVFKLERLYEQEPVRFHRPLEDWRAAFQAVAARYATSVQDYVFLIGDASGATAYVLARRSHWSGTPRLYVTEYAGCRAHIVAAMPGVPMALGSDAIDLNVPDYDTELLRSAVATGLMPEVGFLLTHTVKISSLGSFVRGIKPLVEERLGRTGAGGLAFQPGAGGTYDIIIGEEHFPFPVPAFTTLVFGSPRPETFEDVGFGAGLLGRLFPVPLPLPGLNYA